ncbi:hypothetical protein KRX51_09110 [Corynebacterium sp. TAE3-ERU12]|uniref:alpha/beta hydrolase-fold protein n=1 Tax=Corynebacterium sp. TAE3-ERU12 TaxID=2849491 RepID=UPI001C45B7B0|nr:alpha/beta hydrolase-fold protein [Corynebacterium sp. TAE3-ERU12]MBV7296067.1 hypothetical protein [Corynebacterium sp. TAE3-ERU12]
MSQTAPRMSAGRRLLAAALALPLSAGLAVTTVAAPAAAQPQLPGSSEWTPQPQPDQERSPIRETNQVLEGLPEGVSVEKVQWLTERHVKLFINSAVMTDHPIAVELMLPRDWYRSPDRTFPTVWHLDGMRAREDFSGWSTETTIGQFYSDKNVMVVMPVGGQASFYTDWDQPNKDGHYMWETFLINEMIPVLREGWRANGDRAITGLSMGGTAAVNIAEHHPDLFRFVASFSGYLDTTSPGMPAAIASAVAETGGYDAGKMWGPPGSQRWVDNDPKLGIEALRGMSVYVSAGNGNTGQWDEPSTYDPNLPANTAGWGLELLSRMTTETFVQEARRADVDVTVQFRESGTHTWPYWQFETTQAWAQIADALNLGPGDRGVTCTVKGAIEQKVASFEGLGNCLSDEYPIGDGGVAQDFTNGRAYWHPNTGAHLLYGRIGARYAELGGPNSVLGFPTSSELGTPDGVGRFVTFEHGSIYWTPKLDAHLVLGDFLNVWGDNKWELGPLGYPTSDRREVAGGEIQEFEKGVITRVNDGAPYAVFGKIGEHYRELGGPEGDLGHPIGKPEGLTQGGVLQRFEHGIIYWHPATGAHSVPKGDIFDHWGKSGWETGPFGYPVSDQKQIPSGGLEQEFQGGWIRQINGNIQEERR